MKTVKLAVAVLVWCAVSVGCVAEEAKQPVVAETPAMPVVAATHEKSMASSDDEITVTTHVDPETGAKYSEIRGSVIVKNIQYIAKSKLRRYWLINNSIFFEQIIGGPKSSFEFYGRVTLPDDFDYKNTDALIGKKADFYCYALEKNDHYVVENYCNLSGRHDYFLIIE